MAILKITRDGVEIEVDIEGHEYEYSPEINVVGYAYVTATDMDGKPVELTEEEEARAHELLGNEPHEPYGMYEGEN